MKYSNMFYFRIVLIGMNFFIFYAGISLLITPDEEYEGLESEICNEREEITGYCLDSETIEIKPIDPRLIYILLGLMGISTVYNSKKIFEERTKGKDLKSNWDDEFKKY